MPVAQLGPGMLLLDAPSECPPGEATILFRVDGSERSWTVALPNGISADSKRVVVAGVQPHLGPIPS